MKTGGLEIWNTLVGLCKPDPKTGLTSYQPIRDKLIDLYGGAADSPHLFPMFRVILDMGGAGSPHLQDLLDFTTVHVNPKLRKLREEAYSVVAPYPLQLPRVKTASLKWAWKQTPVRGYCPVPPSINYRFSDVKYKMRSLMEAIEKTLTWLSKFSSTVVEGASLEVKNKKVRWIAEVDISIMSKIFGIPERVTN